MALAWSFTTVLSRTSSICTCWRHESFSSVREGARAHLDYGRKKAVVARVEGYSARFTYETRANILRLKRQMDLRLYLAFTQNSCSVGSLLSFLGLRLLRQAADNCLRVCSLAHSRVRGVKAKRVGSPLVPICRSPTPTGRDRLS